MAGTKSRFFAVIFTIFMIIFSILIGNYKTVAGLRGEAEHVFFNGENNYIYSVKSDMEKRANCAANIQKTLENEILREPEVDNLLMELNSNINDILYNDDINSIKVSNDMLTDTVNNVMKFLDDSSVSNNIYAKCKLLSEEMESYNRTIQLNEYNYYADKYNNTIKQFPVSIFAHILDMGNLSVFGSTNNTITSYETHSFAVATEENIATSRAFSN